MKRRLNWRPDIPDRRDKRFGQRIRLAAPPPVPPKIDLRPLCPPIVDQGQIGSCTGNALAGYMGFLEMGEMADPLLGPEEFPSAQFEPYSRLFIYWNEREEEGTTEQDAGASIRDGIKSLASIGGCGETVWPYAQSLVHERPNQAAYAEAKGHVITLYERIDNTQLNQIRECLASGSPIVFGFTVYESFMTEDVAKTGVMKMPGLFEATAGGHAVLAVGYDDDRQVVIVRNSWGTSWGEKGYFYMPYAYITNDDLTSDFWKVTK